MDTEIGTLEGYTGPGAVVAFVVKASRAGVHLSGTGVAGTAILSPAGARALAWMLAEPAYQAVLLQAATNVERQREEVVSTSNPVEVAE